MNKQPRHLAKVIDRVAALVPGLDNALASTRASAIYTPPEEMVGVWQRASRILGSYMNAGVKAGTITQEQALVVQRIWAGQA